MNLGGTEKEATNMARLIATAKKCPFNPLIGITAYKAKESEKA